MTWFRALVAAFVLTLPAAASAAPPIGASGDELRLDPKRIDAMLSRMVADERIAGGEVLIWKDGKEAYFGKAGWADRETGRPIARGDLFQIWSMTKPVTGVALMRLWEQGRFRLDDPLANYLPEYAATKVMTGLDASGQPILKAPDRPILIRDVLRHTAGFAYWKGDATYWERQIGIVDPLNPANTLAEANAKLATIPLMYEPGSQWRYSAASDVQARLVEVLSGELFEDFVRANLFVPLRMVDTAWTQPEAKYSRLVTPYALGTDKRLHRKGEEETRLLNFSERKLTMGGAGLASTIDDYMRFARMLLGRGEVDGVRILKPSTVGTMTANQLDPKITERWWLPDKGNGGFGFDVFVRTGQPRTVAENRGAVGEFWWDGAWSSLFWVDPANNMAVVFMVQKDPYDGTLHHDIREAVYGADYLGPPGD